MKRLPGGYIGNKPSWSSASSPGIWSMEEVLARRAAGTWPSPTALFDPYFESVSLLLHMNGSNGSTTFVDSSLDGLTVTATGNAQISTAQSKFGGASAYFDGSGDWLTASTATAGNFGVSDFTIEAWIYKSSTTNIYATIVGNNTGTFQVGSACLLVSSSGIISLVSNPTNPCVAGATAISLNTWYHVAVTRSGNTFRLFLNGVLDGTGTASDSLNFSSGNLLVGRNGWDVPQSYWHGYIDEVRITRGVARYTANFAVPGNASSDEGAALYDPYFDYVSLLLRCNGENNSTTFTDSSNNALAITRNGDAKISTTQARFGGASAYFDGTGDWLSCPNTNAQFSFGTGDFTYEFWFNSTDTKAYSALLTRPYSSPGGILISLNGSTGDGAPEIYWNEYLNGLFFKSSVTGLNNGRWHHFAFVRTGTTCYMFIDGAQVASKASVSTSVGSTPVYIGTDSIYAGRDYVGYIDDVRITKGVCRYTTAFRPVGPYATSGKLVDPYLTNTSLLLPMTGDNGNTSFFDRSNNFLRATENGNAKVSTTQSKFGGTSAYFDGTGDYLTLPSSTAYDLGTDYTIEFWVYPASTPNYNFGLVHRGFYSTVTSNWTGLAFSIRCLGSGGSGNLRFYFYATTNANEQVINTTGSLSANTWTHIAMSRSGTTGYAFINGVLAGTITSLNTPAASSETLRIGRWDYSAGNEDLNGYIDDLRITKGAARYTSAFTPPERAFNDEAFNDPHYNAVSLLLHMDGTNNSTTFTDSSVNGLTVTAIDNVKISTTQSKIGQTSAYFDGNGDRLSIADDPGLEIGGSDFTLECWIYPTALKGYQAIASKSHTAADANGWILIFEANNAIVFYVGNGSWSIALNTGTIISVNTWYHLAVTRNGNTWRLFVNGKQVATTSNSITVNEGTLPFYIGHYPYFPGANSAQDFSGYIDEFRLTKGVARYVSDFIPATAPFYNTTIPTSDPSFSSVSLLLHMNGTNGSTTFTDSSSNALTVTANGNAQISTAQGRFGGASAYFDGTGDSLSIASNIAFALGTGAFTVEMYIYPTVNGIAGGTTLLDFRATVDANPWTFFFKNAGAGNLLGMYYATGTTFAEWGGTGQYLALNQWYHIALVSDGTTYRLFVNGTAFTVSSGSATVVNLGTTSKPCRIGIAADGTSAPYTGYIDDLRITKGVARYSSNFYIPRAAFPDA